MKEVHLLEGREGDLNSEKLVAFHKKIFILVILVTPRIIQRFSQGRDGVTQGTGTREGESNSFFPLLPTLLTTNNILGTSEWECSMCILVGRDPQVLLLLHSSDVPIAIFLTYQGIAFPFVSHLEFPEYTRLFFQNKESRVTKLLSFFLHSNAQMAMNGILLGNGAKVQ